MQTSKPYKIFGHRGIDISQAPQGRNVQPFTSNKKLQQPPQRQIQSPFDGYASSASTLQNNLAVSQVSDFNSEITRRLIKQELNKINAYDLAKIRTDVDVMKTEIRTIKENVLKNNTHINKPEKSSEELKQQILKELDKLFNEYHDQTAKNLRQVIKKMDQNIKRDCATKFLSINFVSDAEKQFLEVEDRIQLLQSKVDGNKKQRQNQDPVVVAETLDLRLKKVEREIESLKKQISQNQTHFNQLSNANSLLKTKQNDDDEKVTLKIQELKKHNSEFQKELKGLHQAINQLKLETKQTARKITALEENQERSPDKLKSPTARWVVRQESNETSQVKQFLNSERGLAVSGVFNSSGKEAPDDGNYKKLFKSPEKGSSFRNDSINESNQFNANEKQQQPNAHINYQIDKNNYLMDQDGNYILNQNGKQIQLSQDQIAILRQSTLVKLRQ